VTCLYGALEKRVVAALFRDFPYFMEPEGSLLSSKKSTTCPYPGPNEYYARCPVNV
jgi:hypothetical protein